MRVVSQNRKCDVPYEMCAFSLGKTPTAFVIYARSRLLTDKQTPFAAYSTEEKAIKAMEMLREEYQKYYSNSGGGMMATEDVYIQPFAFNHPKVFQFPKDEEIEV